MATELGVGYLSILPETSKIGPGVKKAFAGVARGADRDGKQVGTRFGVGLNGAIGTAVSRSAGIFAAGFAAVKVGGFLKGAITQASDLGETTSKVAQIFGPAAKDIMAFSKTSSTALGQTQQAALDANATFGIFGKAAGLQGKELSGFTTELTTLASDLASFNNTTPEQAIEAVGAALRGETEPMRAYGVLLDDASLRSEALSQGLIKTTKTALTPQNKVLAAQALILKQTKTAQGDFARTSGGLANQQRILSARFTDFKTSIGAVALPMVTSFVGFLNNKAIPVFKEIKDGVTAFGSAWKYNDGEITSSGFPGFMERVGYQARQAFDYFKAEVLPRLKDFGGYVTGTVIPALQGMAGFVKQNKDFFVPFAVAIGGIIAALKVWAVVQGVLNAVMLANPIGLVVVALAALVAGLVWAYKNSDTFKKVVDTAFKAVVAAGKFMWDNYLKPMFSAFVVVITQVWQKVQTFGRVFKAVFDAIKEPAKAALEFIVTKMLGFISFMLTAAAKAFGWVPGIGEKLKGASAAFATFAADVNRQMGGIADQTINVGIKYTTAGVATVAGANASAARAAEARRFGLTRATGGPIYGPGTGTSDSIPALLSNGEHVLTAKEVQAAGGHGAVYQWRKSLQGFAAGGAVGMDVVLKRPNTAALMKQIAAQTLALAKPYITAGAKKLASAGGPGGPVNPGLGGALGWARTQVGKPYLWGGVGPGGYDCSGFMSAITNYIQGRPLHQRRFATGSLPGGMFVPGPGAFELGWFTGNPGHVAGTLNGVNVESSGGVGVRVGGGARGASNGLFNRRGHLKGYAQGGAVFGGDAPFDLLNPRGERYVGDKIAKLIPTYAQGTPYVPNNQLAYLHKGEAVVPAGANTGTHVTVYIGNEEFTGRMRVVAEDVVADSTEFGGTTNRMGVTR